MKFFAVFSAVLAVACATNTWTLNQLSSALANPTTEEALKPGLTHALNVFMNNMFDGQDMNAATLTSAAGSIGTYTLNELDAFLTSGQLSPAFRPYFANALNELMYAIFTGHEVTSISVDIPALEYSYMNLQDLDQALRYIGESEQKTYLEDALNTLMSAIWSGEEVDSIVVALPVKVAEAVAPTPVAIAEGAAPAPSPVAVAEVAEVATPAASVTSSPLVQIILNVNNPDDVAVVSAPVRPVPSVTSDLATIVERPQPVASLNPIDALAPMPVETNPITDVNPIDILAPLPVESNPVSPIAVAGPMI